MLRALKANAMLRGVETKSQDNTIRYLGSQSCFPAAISQKRLDRSPSPDKTRGYMFFLCRVLALKKPLVPRIESSTNTFGDPEEFPLVEFQKQLQQQSPQSLRPAWMLATKTYVGTQR